MYVKDCDLKQYKQRRGHGRESMREEEEGVRVCVLQCAYMFVCGDTDAAQLAGGIQPFASGKGRHDEVMVTVRIPRSDIILTRFCFFH